jgi:hypothetical protein
VLGERESVCSILTITSNYSGIVEDHSFEATTATIAGGPTSAARSIRPRHAATAMDALFLPLGGNVSQRSTFVSRYPRTLMGYAKVQGVFP